MGSEDLINIKKYSFISNNLSLVNSSAKKEVDALMNYINRILVLSVNGEDPDSVEMSDVSCTGSCSTCGGCH